MITLLAICYCFLDQVKVTDMNLDLLVDFEQQRLVGSVVLTVEKVDATATHLVSDDDNCYTYLTRSGERIRNSKTNPIYTCDYL